MIGSAIALAMVLAVGLFFIVPSWPAAGSKA
jgi:hypothetical protein